MYVILFCRYQQLEKAKSRGWTPRYSHQHNKILTYSMLQNCMQSLQCNPSNLDPESSAPKIAIKQDRTSCPNHHLSGSLTNQDIVFCLSDSRFHICLSACLLYVSSVSKAAHMSVCIRYDAVDSGGEWGGSGPGVGHRMTADEIRMQQQVIIAGRRCGSGWGRRLTTSSILRAGPWFGSVVSCSAQAKGGGISHPGRS